jgi:hypothetical protein
VAVLLQQAHSEIIKRNLSVKQNRIASKEAKPQVRMSKNSANQQIREEAKRSKVRTVEGIAS